MRALWTSASGMTGQQFNIDTISNNLSNVNTAGFKKVRADFEDLVYQNSRIAGTPATDETVEPTGLQVGHGVRVAASQRMFEQGSLQNTNNVFDMAIAGEGFFRILTPDGSLAYTRNGAFKLDNQRQFVTSDGHRLMPELILPEGAINETLSISKNGRVSVQVAGMNEAIDIGQLEIHRFVNPAGLQAVGQNLFKVTGASGQPIAGTPGLNGFGSTEHRFLEMSNVQLVSEMVNMITAQRAYELNSKAIQTSDTMLGIANNLRR